jgi:hypothetical protein
VHGPSSRVTEKERRTRPGHTLHLFWDPKLQRSEVFLVLADNGFCFYAFDNFLPSASFFASPVPHPLPHCSLVSFPHRVARPRCALTHLAPRTSFLNTSLTRTATLTVPRQCSHPQQVSLHSKNTSRAHRPVCMAQAGPARPGTPAPSRYPARPGLAPTRIRSARGPARPKPPGPGPDTTALSPVLLIRALASCAFSERSTQSAIAHDTLPGHPRGLRC